ncbi:70 kDa peptidyl-prolyl isomerase [Trifolium pratense]|uniref:70 kDa peptidyl-prolyl isomerase n=1 Tax=Trifolium pratense TaxID=57577 RepID=A0A2K3MV69_TRIPR|nr:70 kDa peptidyl-prolyl isomerase [Trifolium pratense]
MLNNRRKDGWTVGGGGWKWRRQLFECDEEMIFKCCAVLKNLLLEVDAIDKWMWFSRPTNGYLVRDAYHLLTCLVSINMAAHKDVIWNKVVLLKVTLFAWRMLNDRLPSKYNLICRSMHLENSALCLGGCGVDETIDHLVVGCDIWITILNWLGIFGPLPNVVADHVTEFCNTYLFAKEVRIGLQVIWLTCCWSL